MENLRRLACVTRAALLQPLLLPDPVIAPDPKDEGAFAPPPAPAPDFKPVAQAFANRYASLPPATRAMLALIVPHSRLAPDMAALDAVIRSDQHPLVRAVALCTRVADPTDQNLTAAISADDPSIAAIASAVEARLKAGLRFYALLTPADIRPGPGAPK